MKFPPLNRLLKILPIVNLVSAAQIDDLQQMFEETENRINLNGPILEDNRFLPTILPAIIKVRNTSTAAYNQILKDGHAHLSDVYHKTQPIMNDLLNVMPDSVKKLHLKKFNLMFLDNLLRGTKFPKVKEFITYILKGIFSSP